MNEEIKIEKLQIFQSNKAEKHFPLSKGLDINKAQLETLNNLWN